jgi:hypothetical protein
MIMMSLIFRIWRAHRVTFRLVAPSQVLPAGGGLTYRSMVEEMVMIVEVCLSERLRNCFNESWPHYRALVAKIWIT